jgi:hypothetical protein
MAKKSGNEPSYPNRRDLEEPLLWVLDEMGGSVRFSTHGRTIERKLGEMMGLTEEQMTFSAPNYHSQGNRKWRTEIQFVRQKLKDDSCLEKDAAHDWWVISPAGYRRIGKR